MDLATGISIMLAGYGLVVAIVIYICYWTLPLKRNIQLFRADELKQFGGMITIGWRSIRIKPMASITVGAYSITIHQDGDMIKLTFNTRTPILVEVYR